MGMAWGIIWGSSGLSVGVEAAVVRREATLRTSAVGGPSPSLRGEAGGRAAPEAACFLTG